MRDGRIRRDLTGDYLVLAMYERIAELEHEVSMWRKANLEGELGGAKCKES